MVESALPEVIHDALHDAAIDPARWGVALRELARFVAGDGPRALGAITVMEPSSTAWLLTGTDEPEREYGLADGARHPLFTRTAALPEGFVGSSDGFADPNDLARSTLARTHLRDDGTVHGLSAVVLAGEARVAALHILGRRGGGPWRDGADARLRVSLGAVRRAVETYATLRRARARAAIDDALLDRMDVATFVLDPRGAVVRRNSAARALAERGDGVLVRDGLLACARERADRDLHRALAEVHAAPAATAVVIAPRTTQRRPLLLFVSTVRDPSRGAHVATSVIVRDPDVAAQGESMLRAVFGLSPTEARLSVAIAEGATPTEAAELLGMSVLTARTHLKRIFHKTATTRQAELVRLVLAEFPPVTSG